MASLTVASVRAQARPGRLMGSRRSSVKTCASRAAGWAPGGAGRGRQVRRRNLTTRAGPDPDDSEGGVAYEAEDEDGEYGEDEEGAYDEEDFDYQPESDSTLRLYLDSADVRQWDKWAESGLFWGFTTNPSILRRDNVRCTMESMRSLVQEAAQLDAVELQLQAWGRTPDELFGCGAELYELDPDRVVVKLPITLNGLKAARRLSMEAVPFTLTGLYSSSQIVTALAAGANYAAPYLGRMNDAGRDGIEEIAQMQSIIDMCSNFDGEVRLLVASIREPAELTVLAAEGCNTFTISPAVAEKLVEEPLTSQAAEVFQVDAEEMGA